MYMFSGNFVDKEGCYIPCGQVKHVVRQQEKGQSSGGDGPSAEIRLWHTRGDDLAIILVQLDSPGQEPQIP